MEFPSTIKGDKLNMMNQTSFPINISFWLGKLSGYSTACHLVNTAHQGRDDFRFCGLGNEPIDEWFYI